MKRMLFTISLTLLSFLIIAQNKSAYNISNKVQTELKNLYPNAKSIKWSSHEEGTIEASFIIKGKKLSIIFKADTLFAEKIEINKNNMPKAVKNHLKSYYKGYSIIQTDEIKRSPSAKDKNIYYWIELEKGIGKKVIICYSNGIEMTAFNKNATK